MNYNKRTQDIPSFFHPIASFISLFRPHPQSHIYAADCLYEAAQIAWERVQDVNPLETELNALWAYHFPDVAGATQCVPVSHTADELEEVIRTPSTGCLADVESALDSPSSSNYLAPPRIEHRATPPPPSKPTSRMQKSGRRRSPRSAKPHATSSSSRKPRQRRKKKIAVEKRTYRDVPSALGSPAPSPVLPKHHRRAAKAERVMDATYRDNMDVDEDSDDSDVKVSSGGSKRRKRVVDPTFRPEFEAEDGSDASRKRRKRAVKGRQTAFIDSERCKGERPLILPGIELDMKLCSSPAVISEEPFPSSSDKRKVRFALAHFDCSKQAHTMDVTGRALRFDSQIMWKIAAAKRRQKAAELMKYVLRGRSRSVSPE